MDGEWKGKGVVPLPAEQFIVSFGVQKAYSREEWSEAQYLAKEWNYT